MGRKKEITVKPKEKKEPARQKERRKIYTDKQ